MVAQSPVFTRQWTYDEVSAIADEVRRELVDGEIFEMPSPTLSHQDIILRLALLFSLWARQNGGKAFISPVDLVVSERTYFIPDFVFYSAAQMATGQVERDPKRLHVAPALIVEVLSDATARNDRVRKMRAYAQFGVAHYWIVDPVQRTIEAYELHEGIYHVAATHEGGEVFTPVAFTGLEIPLVEVFGPVAA
jgi:Uma2 family endonuclease